MRSAFLVAYERDVAAEDERGGPVALLSTDRAGLNSECIVARHSHSLKLDGSDPGAHQ
jgi:hypothetical protein